MRYSEEDAKNRKKFIEICSVRARWEWEIAAIVYDQNDNIRRIIDECVSFIPSLDSNNAFFWCFLLRAPLLFV